MTKKAASTKTETGLTFSIKHDSEGRVNRGGSWINAAGYARAEYRSRDFPGLRDYLLGIRLVRDRGDT